MSAKKRTQSTPRNNTPQGRVETLESLLEGMRKLEMQQVELRDVFKERDVVSMRNARDVAVLRTLAEDNIEDLRRDHNALKSHHEALTNRADTLAREVVRTVKERVSMENQVASLAQELNRARAEVDRMAQFANTERMEKDDDRARQRSVSSLHSDEVATLRQHLLEASTTNRKLSRQVEDLTRAADVARVKEARTGDLEASLSAAWAMQQLHAAEARRLLSQMPRGKYEDPAVGAFLQMVARIDTNSRSASAVPAPMPSPPKQRLVTVTARSVSAAVSAPLSSPPRQRPGGPSANGLKPRTFLVSPNDSCSELF